MPPAMMMTVIPRRPTTTGADGISMVCKFRSERNWPPIRLDRVADGEEAKTSNSAKQRAELAESDDPRMRYWSVRSWFIRYRWPATEGLLVHSIGGANLAQSAARHDADAVADSEQFFENRS